MKTKIFALILCLATLLTAVLPMSVSAEEIDLKNATPPGALAISELNAAPLVDGVSYQYIEIVNLSTKTVDLSNYYLYRWGFSNGSPCAYEYTGLQRMYGTAYNKSTTHIVKVNLNGTIPAGETMVVWLWVSTDDTATCPTNTDAFVTYWKTTLEKDASWTIKNTAVVNVDAYPATAVKNIAENKGFLPGKEMGCFIDLIHKDVRFNVNNGTSISKSKQSATTDALKVLDADDNASRHRAADCSVIFFTYDTGVETATTSHNYYEFVDPDVFDDAFKTELQEGHKYTKIKYWNQLYTVSDGVATLTNDAWYYTNKDENQAPTVFDRSQIIPSLACGKTTSGKYSTEAGGGMKQYYDKGKYYANPTFETALVNGTSKKVMTALGDYEYKLSNSAIFFDDGADEPASPGTLNDGQYGYENGLVVYGAQNKLDTETAQTVRFVGYIENIEKYTEVGFEIFGYTDNDTLKHYDGIANTYYAKKAISVDTVYKSIKAGEKTSTVTDIAGKDGYLMAVAISGLPVDTASTDTLTLYVTPYGVIDNGDGSTTTVYGKRVALDLEVFDALNAAN